MRFCPECDTRLFPDDDICANCGYQLFDERPKKRPPGRQTRGRRARPPPRRRHQRRRDEELPPPREPPLRPPMEDDKPKGKRTPFNYGTWLGLIAILLILIAVFLPWYTVNINIKTGEYNTDGDFELIKINGWEGFQLNQPPKEGEDQPEVFTLSKFTGGIPVTGLIFVIPLIIGIIRVFLAKQSRKRGKILIKTGILCLIPIIIILVIISQLPNIAKGYDLSSSYDDVLDAVSSNPFKGEYIVNVTDWGEGSLDWGVRLGGGLLLIGSIWVILGGIVDIIKGREYDLQYDEKKDYR